MKICKVIIVFILTFVVCSPTQSVAGGGATKKVGAKLLELATGGAPGAKPKAPNGGDAAPGGGPRNPRVPGNPPTGGGSPNPHTRPEITDAELDEADKIVDSLPDELFPREHFKDFKEHEVPWMQSDIVPKVDDAEVLKDSKLVRTRQELEYKIPEKVEQKVGDLWSSDSQSWDKYKDKKIKEVLLINHDYVNPDFPQNVKVVLITRGKNNSQMVVLAPEGGGKIKIEEGHLTLPDGAQVVPKSEYDTWLKNDSEKEYYLGQGGWIYHNKVPFGNPHWPPD